MKKLLYASVLVLTLCLATASATPGCTPSNDIINLNDIIEWEATETGLLLHLKDGSGYYLERGELNE